jgi:tetratricopeptide (TPR) repeat protein
MSRQRKSRPGRQSAGGPPSRQREDRRQPPHLLPMRGPWRWVLRLALALFAPILLLGALEFTLRASGYGYPTRLALPVRGSSTYGVNLRFGWRFFPPAIARVPLLFSFPVQKPPETCRIFILGASAAQGYPDGAFSFARVLEVLLARRYPGVTFEVINTSIVATNSHVVLPIAREVVRYDPDLLIVYLGNNEVIGPYGIGSDLTRPAGSLAAVRFGITLRTTKIGQLLQSAVGRISGRDRVLQEWGGMEQYARNKIAAEDPRLEKVYGYFERNLTDICEAASQAGVPVVLGTVAVNLWDSAPFASLHRTDLPSEQLAVWDSLYAKGVAAVEAGHVAEALASFAAATEIDSCFADLQFRQGSLHLAAGDTSLAREHFLRARDRDALRFRADSRINAIIRRTARERSAVFLADAALVFAKSIRGPTAPSDADLFYEHVHPTFTGNDLLARAFLPAVAAALPDWVRQREAGNTPLPTRRECADALLYTDWNEYRMTATILTLMGQYPFPEQLDHAERYQQIQAHLQVIMDRATPEIRQQTYEAYARAVREHPQDLLLRANFVELLKDLGQQAAAAQQISRILSTQPPLDWKSPSPLEDSQHGRD